MQDRPLDASALRDWAYMSVGDLISHTDEINRLNVFPVADSDTGTNMLFTMRSAVAEADALRDFNPGDDSSQRDDSNDVSRVAAALAQGALHGARGNSGVILSQVLRGIADVTARASSADGNALTEIDAELLAAAFRSGVELIVGSMGGDMVRGTIVSVLEAAGDALAESAAGGSSLARALGSAAEAGARALDRTPEQLQVLADAGVVDAGGRGLLVLLDALAATISGRAISRMPYAGPVAVGLDPNPPLTVDSSQFEVMYELTTADSPAVEQLRSRLDKIGDSVAIASAGPGKSDSQALLYSVHVHTADAGAAVEAGLAVGALSHIQISVITTVPSKTPRNSWSPARTVLAVVDGVGAAELFQQEGAHVLRAEFGPCGSAVNAQKLVRALVDTGASQVMVLPNGYVAAEELVAGCAAGIGCGIDVIPLPVASMVQGLAALAVHDPDRPAVDDGYTMARAAAGTRYGSVRVATEHALTWAGRCEPGDGLGISGGEVLVVGSDVVSAALGLIDLFLTAGGELVTVLVGEDVDLHVAEVLGSHVRRDHLGIEFATYRTAHRGDVLIIGVE